MSATRALDMLRQGAQVDLVITDQVMPRMTGLQFAEAIAKEWPDLPVIIATGYAEMAPAPASTCRSCRSRSRRPNSPPRLPASHQAQRTAAR